MKTAKDTLSPLKVKELRKQLVGAPDEAEIHLQFNPSKGKTVFASARGVQFAMKDGDGQKATVIIIFGET
jgi:hypothetical protein